MKYTKIENTILQANEAVHMETGEVVKISPETKLVYSYMLNQFEMHQKFRNEAYVESWDRIFSTVCDVASQKQKKIVKELTTLGLVVVEGKKNAKKILKHCSQVDWVFNNKKLEDFLSPSAKTRRENAKKKRIEDWKEKKKAKGEWKDSSRGENVETTPHEPCPVMSNTTVSDPFNWDDLPDEEIPF